MLAEPAPHIATADPLDPVFRALSDPTRRAVLDILRDGPRTTGDLAARFPVTRYAVMKHLDQLEQVGLVLVRRKGRERWNYLNAVPLQQIAERWIGPYEALWASGLVELKRRLETSPGKELSMSTTSPVTAPPQAESIPQGSIDVALEIPIDAPPEKVWHALTRELPFWWGAGHHLGESPTDLTLELEVGGRLMEHWGDNGGALWGRVSSLHHGKWVEIEGRFGMGNPVMGVICFEIEPADSGSLLKLSHKAIGGIRPGAQEGYTEGWGLLLGDHLKAWVERGEAKGLRGSR